MRLDSYLGSIDGLQSQLFLLHDSLAEDALGHAVNARYDNMHAQDQPAHSLPKLFLIEDAGNIQPISSQGNDISQSLPRLLSVSAVVPLMQSSVSAAH